MTLKYICKCHKEEFFFKNNFSYWENRNQTTDEKEISNELYKIYLTNKDILHIGIGNSEFSKLFSKKNNVDGITISQKEILLAKKINLINYKYYLLDKYSVEFQNFLKKKKYDFIIDTNLKSYACCEDSFNLMIYGLIDSLKIGGLLITSRKGMNWTKKLTHKLSFNLKNFFYYKFKEIDGDPANQLTIKELQKICEKSNIKLSFNDKLCYLQK